LFSDRRSGDADEKLYVVELDPNSDGVFADARIAKTISVAASKVEGHGGHHDVCVTGRRRVAYITNPGEGSIWVLNLESLEIVGRFQVGGVPTRVACVGG
jgi:hypothetical protein